MLNGSEKGRNKSRNKICDVLKSGSHFFYLSHQQQLNLLKEAHVHLTKLLEDPNCTLFEDDPSKDEEENRQFKFQSSTNNTNISFQPAELSTYSSPNLKKIDNSSTLAEKLFDTTKSPPPAEPEDGPAP